jgi:tyrosyl-DNA phosphodiesterase-1
MASQQLGNAPPSKRRKLDDDSPNREAAKPNFHKRLDEPITPPSLRRKSPEPLSFTPTWSFDQVPTQTLVAGRVEPATPYHGSDADGKPKCWPSPVQLTRIEKLSTDQNVDAVGLSDLLGDPLIKECWNFNFLFDLDFVMQVQYLTLISEAAVRLTL